MVGRVCLPRRASLIMTLAGLGRWAWGYSVHTIAMREDDWPEVGQVRVWCPHQIEPGRREGDPPGRHERMPIPDDDEQHKHKAGPGRNRRLGLPCPSWPSSTMYCVRSSVVGKHRPGVVVENVGGQGISARRLTSRALIHRGGGPEGRMTR